MADLAAEGVELRRCHGCDLDKPLDAFRPRRGFGRRGKLRKNCHDCVAKFRDPTLPEPRYWIRHHAVERYIERCSPSLSLKQARVEMIRRMDSAPMLCRPPWWLASGIAKPGVGMTEGYLLIDKKTVFVVGVYSGDRKLGLEPRVKTVLIRENLIQVARRRVAFMVRRLRSRFRVTRSATASS